MGMTDSDKVLMCANFLFMEGIRIEDSLRMVLGRKLAGYRACDQLDMLEVIEYMDRWQYFNELATVLNNVLLDEHKPRPVWRPLDRGPHTC